MGFLDSLFKGKSKTKVVQTSQEAQARDFLATQMSDPTQAPVEGIAGRSPAEIRAAEMAESFADTAPEGQEFLRSFLQDGSFAETDAGKALIETVRRTGQEETARVGRSLQLRGGTSSTPGRDILGRSVEDIERNILSTLVPYEQQQQQNRMTAAQILSATGESATLNRLNALSQTGAVERQLEQLQKSAEFAAKQQQVQSQMQSAQTLLAHPAQHVTTRTPSLLSQAAPIIGAVGGAAVMGGGLGALNPMKLFGGGGGSPASSLGGGPIA